MSGVVARCRRAETVVVNEGRSRSSAVGDQPLPSVSIVVSTKNRAAKLERCLKALDAVEYSGPLEVVVVDNGSTDGTLDTVRAAQRQSRVPIHYVYQGTGGVGTALNAGVRRSRGDLLLFTDDDCYVETTFVAAWVDAFRTRGIAFGGGRILLYDDRDYPVTINPDVRYRPFRPGAFVQPGVFQGANLALRREVLEAIGLYDEDFGPGSRFKSGADVEVCARACSQGWSGAYVPDPVVYHHHGRTKADLVPLYHRYSYGLGAFFAKGMVRFPNRHKYAARFVRSLWSNRRVRYIILPELRGCVAYLLFLLAGGGGQRPAMRKMLRSRYSYLRERVPSRWPRATAAYKAATWTLRERWSRRLEFRDRFGHRYATMAGNWTSFVVRSLGVRDPEILTVLPRVVGDGATVLDVGANIGTYTMPLARLVGPRGRVVAVEAHPVIFGYLTRNVDANGASNVDAVDMAVGPVRGTLAFKDAAHNPGESHVAGEHEGPPLRVKSTTLDTLCGQLGVKRLAYMKLDVEGFEVGVLQGARKLLRANPDIVVQTECFEAHAHRYGWSLRDLHELMTEHGFQAYRADPAGHMVEIGDVRDYAGEAFWMSAARHRGLEAPGGRV